MLTGLLSGVSFRSSLRRHFLHSWISGTLMFDIQVDFGSNLFCLWWNYRPGPESFREAYLCSLCFLPHSLLPLHLTRQLLLQELKSKVTIISTLTRQGFLLCTFSAGANNHSSETWVGPFSNLNKAFFFSRVRDKFLHFLSNFQSQILYFTKKLDRNFG